MSQDGYKSRCSNKLNTLQDWYKSRCNVDVILQQIKQSFSTMKPRKLKSKSVNKVKHTRKLRSESVNKVKHTRKLRSESVNMVNHTRKPKSESVNKVKRELGYHCCLILFNKTGGLIQQVIV